MRISRLLAAVTGVAMLGLTPLATAPANATSVFTTTTAFNITYLSKPVKKAPYAQSLSVDGTVTASDGSTPYTGTSVLQMQAAGTSTWKEIARDPYGGTFYFSIKAKQNAAYRVVYLGHNATSTYDDTYRASISPTVGLKVSRTFTGDINDNFVAYGKITPKYKFKKVIVQVKKGGWRPYKTVRTNGLSKFKVQLYDKRGGGKTYFRFTIPGNKQFVKTVFTGWCERY